MRRLLRSLAIVALAGLVGACGGDSDPPSPTTTPPPATPTATAPPSAACPPEGEPEPLPAAAPALDDLEAFASTFLSQGGAPEDLHSALEGWGLIGPNGGTFDASGDLTGDGLAEVVLVALDVEQAMVTGAPGVLLVLACAEGEYATAHRSVDVSDGALATPDLLALEDLTGDGRADLLYTLQVCGAHTCEVAVRAFGFDPASGALRSLLAAPIEGVPYGEVATAARGDGTADLIVHVGMIGSAGAGPQRELRETYRWDGAAYALAEREVLTPREQWSAIHYVQDADAAFNDGRAAQALTLYEELIASPPSDAFDSAEQTEALQVYARFRVMVTHAFEGRPQDAAAAATLFSEHTPGDTPAMIDVGHAFWEAYRDSEDAAAGCAAAVAYAEQHAGSYEVLNTFGYANPEYGPADLCPAAP